MEVVECLNSLPGDVSEPGFGLRITVAGFSCGGPNFGVSPGHATIWATLRTMDTDLLNESCTLLESRVLEIASNHELNLGFNLTEHFDATMNDPELVQKFVKCTKSIGAEVQIMEEPFYWSEDFGRFTTKTPGFLFGLGAGENCHPLHHSAYDFPDEIIPTGIKLFEIYIRELLK